MDQEPPLHFITAAFVICESAGAHVRPLDRSPVVSVDCLFKFIFQIAHLLNICYFERACPGSLHLLCRLTANSIFVATHISGEGVSFALIPLRLVAVCVLQPDTFNHRIVIEILTHHEDCQGGSLPLRSCRL